MKTICTNKNSNFRNLTVNKQYDAEESEDNLIILNDAGIKAKYNKKYFRIVPQSILDTAQITIRLDLENNNISIEVSHLGRGNAAIDMALNVERASNLCGVLEVDHIDLLKSECDRVSRESGLNTSMELFKRIITEVIRQLKEQRGAFITFSTSVTADTLSYYDSVLLEKDFAGLAFIRRNTNSGNFIALWIIMMNDETL